MILPPLVFPVYIYGCIHVFKYLLTYTLHSAHTHTHTHMCMYIYIYMWGVYIKTLTHLHNTCTHMFMYIYMCVGGSILKLILTYTIHVHTCTHMYMGQSTNLFIVAIYTMFRKLFVCLLLIATLGLAIFVVMGMSMLLF